MQEYEDHIATVESLQQASESWPQQESSLLLPQRPSWDLLDSIDPPPLPKPTRQRPSQKPPEAIIPPPIETSATEHAVAVVVPSRPSSQKTMTKPPTIDQSATPVLPPAHFSEATKHAIKPSTKAIMPP